MCVQLFFAADAVKVYKPRDEMCLDHRAGLETQSELCGQINPPADYLPR